MSHRIEIEMPDGGQMGAYLALPESGRGPGMLVLMEIFGVGVYIREAADRLAALGYVALAPDLYRRTRPGAEYAHDDAGLQAAFAAMGELDVPGAIADAIIALEHLRTLPQTGGRAGVLGFCLGGMLAFGVAQGADPATAVCYYGSGVSDMVQDSASISCPVLFQFGGEDAYIPREQAEQVAAAAETRDGWECHIHDDGGHAFDNWDAPRFSRPEPAKRAWGQTTDFLRRTLATDQTASE
jgi:carboxymethylenebutenolidase